MMKYFFLTIIITYACSYASAQFIFIPKKPIETLKESIDKYESTLLTDSIPFSAIHIIDSRYDTTSIGFYLNGYLSLKDSGRDVSLQHIVDKYYHRLYTPGKHTLIIQLEKLSITDGINAPQIRYYTTGYFACEEFTGCNNFYAHYTSVDTLIREEYALSDNLHKHGRHYNNEFWDYYLLRLCDAMIKATAIADDSATTEKEKYFTEDEIKNQGLQKRNKPILNADTLNSGFYRNFSEFVNNAPGFTYISDTALLKLLELMHYRVGKISSREVPDTAYWGYCDGKDLFIRYGYSFYKLEKKDDGFYIAATLDALRRDANRAGWNLLIGVATLSTSIAAKNGIDFQGFSTIPPPNIPMVVLAVSPSISVLGLQLDWDTGQITF